MIPCSPGTYFDAVDYVCRAPSSEPSSNGIEEGVEAEEIPEPAEIQESFPTLIMKYASTPAPEFTTKRTSEVFVFTSVKPNSIMQERASSLEHFKNRAFLPPGTKNLKKNADLDWVVEKKVPNEKQTFSKHSLKHQSRNFGGGSKTRQSWINDKLKTTNPPPNDASEITSAEDFSFPTSVIKISKTTVPSSPPEKFHSTYRARPSTPRSWPTTSASIEFQEEKEPSFQIPWTAVKRPLSSVSMYATMRPGNDAHFEIFENRSRKINAKLKVPKVGFCKKEIKECFCKAKQAVPQKIKKIV